MALNSREVSRERGMRREGHGKVNKKCIFLGEQVKIYTLLPNRLLVGGVFSRDGPDISFASHVVSRNFQSLMQCKFNTISYADWNTATLGTLNVTVEEHGKMILPLVLQFLTPSVSYKTWARQTHI